MNKSHIQYCVVWSEHVKVYVNGYNYERDTDFFFNFETLEEAEIKYNQVLTYESLVTANLCKIIKTTE